MKETRNEKPENSLETYRKKVKGKLMSCEKGKEGKMNVKQKSNVKVEIENKKAREKKTNEESEKETERKTNEE